jgi:hypothetical protein
MTPSTTREVRDRDDVILAHLKEAGAFSDEQPTPGLPTYEGKVMSVNGYSVPLCAKLGDFFKGGDPK